MASIILDAQSVSLTPATNREAVYFERVNSRLMTKDDVGLVGGVVTDAAVASSGALTAQVANYLVGSALKIGSNGLQVGTMMRWRFAISKSAAGTASCTMRISAGVTGTAADPLFTNFLKPAGTAVVDEGIAEFLLVVQSIGAAGIAETYFTFVHNLATTGFMNQQIVSAVQISAAFDTTLPGWIFGIAVTPGLADVYTVSQVHAELINA